MKKILAFILSLVLVFTLVAFAACSAGGNNFKEVDLTDTETREEFVNALAEKVDVNNLIGNYAAEGWTFGLEEKASTKLAFDKLTVTWDEAEFSANGSVELSENAKISVKGNGAIAEPDIAASLSLTAKGNLTLSDSIYDMFDALVEEYSLDSMGIDSDYLKGLITNFNYSVNAYVDNEVVLISLSESLYNKLPEFITETITSRLIKITLSSLNQPATLDAAPSIDGTAQTEAIKEAINEVIDEIILPLNLTVSVANSNGYAVRISASKESVAAFVDEVLYDDEELATAVKQAVGNFKFELTVRVDKNGAFSSISSESNIKLNLDLTFGDFAVKGGLTMSASTEIKKFSGKVSKPTGDYQEVDFSEIF